MREVKRWSNYFMDIAIAVSTRSKDPKTQVGVVIVNEEGHIIGTGYNGLNPSIDDTIERWRDEVKHDLVIHAEMNAIAHATESVRGAKLYVTLHPCLECSKLISACGIKKVIYLNEKNNESEKKSKELLQLSGISIRKLDT